MSQDKDGETVEAQETLLTHGEHNDLKNVKIQESQDQTGANNLMDMIIKKVQSNEGTIRQTKTKPVFQIPKETKQRALLMQVLR